MMCPKCNSAVAEGAIFCSTCGARVDVQPAENQVKYCRGCGQVIKEGNKFCAKCGMAVNPTVNPCVSNNSVAVKKSGNGKITGSYFVSIISAIISFIIRLSSQQTYYSWSNLLDNRKVVGIDSDLKPFLTTIPVIAAIIVSLMIISDKNVPSQKKITALIINAVFIALSILFIWFDIPYSIVDF